MSSAAFTTVTSLHYVDVTAVPEAVANCVADADHLLPAALPGVPEDEVQARIAAACAAERQSTENRLGQRHAQEAAALRQSVSAALEAFAHERRSYFARIESEVVQLSLAIARRILQREAQLDPLLLAGLVRIALDGLQDSSAVRLHVSPDRLAAWQQHLALGVMRVRPSVIPDASLDGDDCVLHTDAGSARLSFETQLKDVERGFRDLLALRPDRIDPDARQPGTSIA